MLCYFIVNFYVLFSFVGEKYKFFFVLVLRVFSWAREPNFVFQGGEPNLNHI